MINWNCKKRIKSEKKYIKWLWKNWQDYHWKKPHLSEVAIYHLYLQNPSDSYFHTAQKMKFSIKDFFSKCDQIRREQF